MRGHRGTFVDELAVVAASCHPRAQSVLVSGLADGVSAVAVPLSAYRYNNDGSYEYKSELALARAEAGAALDVLGTIDHTGFYNADPNHWWSARDIRRSSFMGDFIYAVSDKGVTCHRLTDFAKTASVTLQGSTDGGGGFPQEG